MQPKGPIPAKCSIVKVHPLNQITYCVACRCWWSIHLPLNDPNKSFCHAEFCTFLWHYCCRKRMPAWERFFLYQPFDDRSIMLQGVYLYQSYANTPILLLWPDWWWISPALVRNFLLHAHTNTLYIMQGARFYGNICGSQTDTQKVTAKCKRSEPLPATDSMEMNRLKMWWVNNRQLADVLVEVVSSL